jgi:lysine/ornithine N-monooxygenase
MSIYDFQQSLCERLENDCHVTLWLFLAWRNCTGTRQEYPAFCAWAAVHMLSYYDQFLPDDVLLDVAHREVNLMLSHQMESIFNA